MTHRVGKEGHCPMYVLYQHHKDADGKIALTELRLSSHKTKWRIDFFNTTEEAVFKLAKIALKIVKPERRSYDDAVKVWTYFDNAWEPTFNALKACGVSMGLPAPVLIEVEDLQWLCTQSMFDLNNKRTQVKPEDFFYEQAPSQSKAIDPAVVRAKLAALFTITESDLIAADTAALKRLYRQAALRLHPDRNGGDGSMMSELNMYWGLFNA